MDSDAFGSDRIAAVSLLDTGPGVLGHQLKTSMVVEYGTDLRGGMHGSWESDRAAVPSVRPIEWAMYGEMAQGTPSIIA